MNWKSKLYNLQVSSFDGDEVEVTC